MNYLIGVIIIAVDQALKIIMAHKSIVVIPDFFSLRYMENDGGAFNIGNISGIIALTLACITGITVFMIKNKDKITNYLPYTLLLAGCCSNLLERIFRGYVIDYFDFSGIYLLAFNISDLSIFVGMVMLIIIYIKKSVKSK